MTKKIIALLLALIMIFSLAACGGNDDDENDEEEQVEENEEKEDEDKDEEKEDEDEDEEDKVIPYDGPDKNNGDGARIEPQVIYSDDVMTIAACGIDTSDEWFGPEIYYNVVNNSDEEIQICLEHIAVNGLLFSAYDYADISPKESVMLCAWLSTDELEQAEVTSIQTVDVLIAAYDAEDYDLICSTDFISVETDAPDNYVQNTDFGGKLVYEAKDLEVYYMGCEADDYGYLSVYFYFKHNSGNHEYYGSVECDKFLINDFDFAQSAYLGTDLIGYNTFDYVILSEDELAEHDIDPDSVETFEFAFSIFDYENWEQVEETSESVKVDA